MAVDLYTYDITTPTGQTRFHLADTNVAAAVWSDGEIAYCLQITGGKPELAAAKALRAAAADASKVAVITRLGQLGNDETKLPEILNAMADKLETAAIQTPVVNSPCRVFVPRTASCPGNMDPW